MKIFLIGYMYSGKTTVGKSLAKKLKYDFADTDELFETRYQCDIPTFFELHGEAEFRIAERQILESLQSDSRNLIISTGGGLPCFNDNMELIKKMGVSVYLEASVYAVYRRFENSKAKRPLLENLTKEEAIEKIKTQLSEREIFYKQANITVSAESMNYEALLQVLTPLL